jgi:ketosteroid isomerase-like protein
MKKTTQTLTFIIFVISFYACNTVPENKTSEIRPYIPSDQKLFDEIVEMDKKFFDAYNNCDLSTQEAILSDDIEFYHDQGGLMTSKADIMKATEENICGKVTRTLIAGSIEVYPINNYGAVQIGFHKFFNNQEPDAESIPSKFIAIWHNEDGHWRMARIISLH